MIKRKILLEFSYIGKNYNGLAYSKIIGETISNKIINALLELRLIPDYEYSEMTFIGRTDKTVSARKNACSVFINPHYPAPFSNFKINKSISPSDRNNNLETNTSPSNELKSISEIKTETKFEKKYFPFCQIINSKLPLDIRAIRWADVEENFNARYQCNRRSYKYFLIPKPYYKNDKVFDFIKVKNALKLLEGKHDFRNLCKVDFSNTMNYERTIYNVSIKKFLDFRYNFEFDFKEENSNKEIVSKTSKITVYELFFEADGFLWHLIRNIVHILELIGFGLETSNVFDFLFNIKKCLYKPKFCMAEGDPLILWDYKFKDSTNIEWNKNDKNYSEKLSDIYFKKSKDLIIKTLFTIL